VIVALSDRVRVEGERPREPLQIFFDNRLMGEFSGAVVMIWNDGLRVMTDALRLPEGTQVLDSKGERETQTLIPRESPQLLMYPHGRLARVYCEENGTVEMVFGDSPAALLNNTNACECGRKQSNEFDTENLFTMPSSWII